MTTRPSRNIPRTYHSLPWETADSDTKMATHPEVLRSSRQKEDGGWVPSGVQFFQRCYTISSILLSPLQNNHQGFPFNILRRNSEPCRRQRRCDQRVP